MKRPILFGCVRHAKEYHNEEERYQKQLEQGYRLKLAGKGIQGYGGRSLVTDTHWFGPRYRYYR